MWARNYNSCLKCKGTDSPHKAKGLCLNCYRKRYKDDPILSKKISDGRKKKYMENKELFRIKNKINKDRIHFGGNKEVVLERDEFKCTVCGRTEDLQVHHIDRSGRTASANNNLENLVTLCRSCHFKEHKKEIINPERISQKMKEISSDPEWRKKKSDIAKSHWKNNKEFREKAINNLLSEENRRKSLAARRTPEVREKLRIATKSSWESGNRKRFVGWNKNFLKCQKCGATEFPHKAGGLCIKCYEKERYFRRYPQYKKGIIQEKIWSDL